jgi:NRPS condensation-like uncharacterized protein
VSKYKLNDVDLAWLRMENPYNPMMIMVVLQLRGQINYERLVTDLKDTLNRYRPFRQRIVRPRQIFSRPYWEDDPDYQIEDHVERLELQSPVNDVAVDKIVNGKINTPLDFSRPLWNITLVDNHPDGSILIVRIHHCIADGISLMQVLLQMTENSSEGPVNQAPGANPNHVEQQVQGEATIGHTKQPAFSRGEGSAIISNTKSKVQTPQPGRRHFGTETYNRRDQHSNRTHYISRTRSSYYLQKTAGKDKKSCLD